MPHLPAETAGAVTGEKGGEAEKRIQWNRGVDRLETTFTPAPSLVSYLRIIRRTIHN